jgi:hypothetical protein
LSLPDIKEELVPVIHTLFKKKKKVRKEFFKATIILLPNPDSDITKRESYRSISLMNTYKISPQNTKK